MGFLGVFFVFVFYLTTLFFKSILPLLKNSNVLNLGFTELFLLLLLSFVLFLNYVITLGSRAGTSRFRSKHPLSWSQELEARASWACGSAGWHPFLTVLQAIVEAACGVCLLGAFLFVPIPEYMWEKFLEVGLAESKNICILN